MSVCECVFVIPGRSAFLSLCISLMASQSQFQSQLLQHSQHVLSLSLPLLTLSFGNRRILKLLLHTAEKDTAVSEWVSGVVNRQERRRRKRRRAQAGQRR